MANYVEIRKTEGSVEVDFSMLNDRITALMEKLMSVKTDILMSSYDWTSLWSYCLKKKDPDILSGMETALDMTGFTARWALSPENEARAKRLEGLIRSMVEDEEELCRIVREESGEIQWE